MMKYKGYIANVEYDDENKVFSGMVINTHTVITFQGTTVQELETELHQDAAVAAVELGLSLNSFVEKSVIDELAMLGRRPRQVVKA